MAVLNGVNSTGTNPGWRAKAASKVAEWPEYTAGNPDSVPVSIDERAWLTDGIAGGGSNA